MKSGPKPWSWNLSAKVRTPSLHSVIFGNKTLGKKTLGNRDFGQKDVGQKYVGQQNVGRLVLNILLHNVFVAQHLCCPTSLLPNVMLPIHIVEE